VTTCTGDAGSACAYVSTYDILNFFCAVCFFFFLQMNSNWGGKHVHSLLVYSKKYHFLLVRLLLCRPFFTRWTQRSNFAADLCGPNCLLHMAHGLFTAGGRFFTGADLFPALFLAILNQGGQNIFYTYGGCVYRRHKQKIKKKCVTRIFFIGTKC